MAVRSSEATTTAAGGYWCEAHAERTFALCCSAVSKIKHFLTPPKFWASCATALILNFGARTRVLEIDRTLLRGYVNVCF